MTLHGKVLIVDDEIPLRQTLARVLQREACEVTTAADGEQALAFLESTDYDLVYLDIRLPGMSGLEVLRCIHAKHPDVPVVLFTAQPDMQSSVEALRNGAADYLLKPLRPEALIENAKAMLQERRKEKRKRAIRSEIEKLQAELKRIDGETGSEPEEAPEPPDAERYLVRGGLVLDLLARRLTVTGRIIEIPPTAFEYLIVLARHAPEVVDYRTLALEAQGVQAESREAQELVKWHIHRIRKAIEPDPDKSKFLFNVRGIGYRLVAD